MPTQLPDGLALAGITEREDPRDAVVLHPKYASATGGLACLPAGAVIGTSSVRREAFIRRDFPHLDIQLIRGNVGTRLAKLDGGEYDAIVLAAAGLKRLGPQFAARISHVLEPEEMMYGVSQGSLGLQCREDDKEVCDMLFSISESHSFARCTAERSLLRSLQGGCQVPLGVHTIVKEGDVLELQCTMLGDQGTVSLRADITGDCKDAHDLGVSLARQLLDSGGREIMGHDGSELAEGQTARPLTYGSAEAPNISARPVKK
jgi:hydroxymethylbilane synthase